MWPKRFVSMDQYGGQNADILLSKNIYDIRYPRTLYYLDLISQITSSNTMSSAWLKKQIKRLHISAVQLSLCGVHSAHTWYFLHNFSSKNTICPQKLLLLRSIWNFSHDWIFSTCTAGVTNTMHVYCRGHPTDHHPHLSMTQQNVLKTVGFAFNRWLWIFLF